MGVDLITSEEEALRVLDMFINKHGVRYKDIKIKVQGITPEGKDAWFGIVYQDIQTVMVFPYTGPRPSALATPPRRTLHP